jgi:hypothetical protein
MITMPYYPVQTEPVRKNIFFHMVLHITGESLVSVPKWKWMGRVSQPHRGDGGGDRTGDLGEVDREMTLPV